MGGGASTCSGKHDSTELDMVFDPVQGTSEQSVIIPDGTLFRQRPAVSEEQIFIDRWIHDKQIEYGIKIEKKHIHAVTTSIAQQRALPANCLSLLDSYLERISLEFDFVARIHAVSDEHTQDLAVSAEAHQLVHHDVPHALEIELRTMNMLEKLETWKTKTLRDAFFQASLACMIRLHDHEQKNTRPGISNEEVTAERVIAWLNTALNLLDEAVTAEETAVKQMIQFMAHRIIVCGTTMIYSQKRTLDLIELLFFLDKHMIDKDVPLSSNSNSHFIELINLTTILVGSNDKNPGASLLNVLEQLKQANMTTLPLIQHYYHEVSVLDKFFSSSQFKAYYNLDRLREHYHTENFSDFYDERGFFEAVNKQAFLIMVVPHISMRPEFLETADERRSKLRSFIQACRFNLSLDVCVFKTEFEAGFAEHHIADMMNVLFFEEIDKEVLFSDSQKGGLSEMVENNLPDMGFKQASVIYSLIDPSVPSRDAKHLKNLKKFWDELTPQNKIILCKELMMAVILQAGAMKALELDLIKPYVKESLSRTALAI